MTQTESLICDQLDLTEAQFARISDVVYKHCGINLHEGKRDLVRSRLAKLLRKYNYTNYDEYLDFVLNDKQGNRFSEMIDSISTNLTSFFREPKHFDFLNQCFLPEIMERKRKTKQMKLRVWSAGCSSGEEPYSIAITLAEAAKNEAWNSKILATDISTRILQKAKAGIYEAQRVATMTPALKNRYLTQTKSDGQVMYEVKNQIQNLIVFKYLNLMESWPFKGPMDFIFCRNVMIYFDKPTQQRLVNRYWDLLASGGVLFTGHSESLTGIEHRFQYVQPTIYRKK